MNTEKINEMISRLHASGFIYCESAEQRDNIILCIRAQDKLCNFDFAPNNGLYLYYDENTTLEPQGVK